MCTSAVSLTGVHGVIVIPVCVDGGRAHLVVGDDGVAVQEAVVAAVAVGLDL